MNPIETSRADFAAVGHLIDVRACRWAPKPAQRPAFAPAVDVNALLRDPRYD
jgi:hypothetical protein